MGVRLVDPVMLILFALLPSALFVSLLFGLGACKVSSNWALPSAARSLPKEGTAGLSQSPELGIWIIEVNSMGRSRSPGSLLVQSVLSILLKRPLPSTLYCCRTVRTSLR